jgi:glycosyltransferase involved in cell wall biosynthesis
LTIKIFCQNFPPNIGGDGIVVSNYLKYGSRDAEVYTAGVKSSDGVISLSDKPDWNYVARAGKILRRSKKTVVWIHSTRLGILLYPWIRRHKVVLTDHGLWGLSPRRTESFPIWLRNMLAEWAFFKFCKKIEVITTVSPYSEKLLSKYHKRVRYVPNGVDVPKYFDEISWKKKENRAVFFARHHPQKDLGFMTEIAEKLTKQGWKIDLGGRGKETSKYLERWRKMNNVEYKFRSEEEKKRLLRKSKLLLQPSKWEAGFTTAVMEALAHKVLPVIRDYGLGETDLAGFLVVVNKKNYMEKITKALGYDHDWRTLGRLLRGKYSWQNIASMYDEVLEEVI